jgi:protein-tyrosine phosphatase
MAQVLNWQNAASQRDVIDAAVRALQQGQCVAFPTETTYQIAANLADAGAVARLAELEPGAALTLALPTPEDALDWVPAMSLLGRRLARRCWPGPVTLVFQDGVERGLVGKLPEEVRRWLCPQEGLALYVPEHEALTETLLVLGTPLVLREAGRKDQAPAVTAEQVQECFGPKLDLIIDDGPSRSSRPCSHVRVQGENWTMLHEGDISAEEIARKTNCVILFVCTGNTCRSPMAAALCKKLLADRLKCSVDELPKRGYEVLSAGLAALPGDPASPDAVEAVQELGADLSGHSSRLLNVELVSNADYLITMTLGHQIAVSARYGQYGPDPQLLDPDENDIADPVGLDREVYRDCARQIQKHLERFVADLPLSAT